MRGENCLESILRILLIIKLKLNFKFILVFTHQCVHKQKANADTNINIASPR